LAQLYFLGSGGGRITTTLQARATGGMILKYKNHQIHLDPGPGARLKARQYDIDARETDIVCVSHVHTDHTNDLPIIMDTITLGGVYKKGSLLANKTVLEGNDMYEKVIQKQYTKNFKEVYTLAAGDKVKFDESLTIEAVKAVHDDVDAIGFLIRTPDFVLGYTGDTELFDEMVEKYRGVDVMIFNVLRPGSEKWKYHLCTEDVIKVLKELQPKICIITHFGMKMVRENPVFEAQRIVRETGIQTIAARDGLRVGIIEGMQGGTISEFVRRL